MSVVSTSSKSTQNLERLFNMDRGDRKLSHSPEQCVSVKEPRAEKRELTSVQHHLPIASSFHNEGTSQFCMGVASQSPSMIPYFFMPSYPSMYGMMMASYPYPLPMMTVPVASAPPKPVKKFASCSLYPPNPNDPPPSRRERPNGCKTVYVGKLPLNITEGIIKEIFKECGEIDVVRMSRRNFCHVRFVNEHHVDQALLLSGYYLQIESSYRKKMHVDFASDNKDQYEYACLQIREHRLAVSSPPPIVPFSEHEYDTIKKQLRDDDEKVIKQSFQVLATWLKRGECNKQNANTFFAMVASAHCNVMRLISETDKLKKELKITKEKLNKKFISNGAWFNDLETILEYATMQKVTDNLTKPQRKQIRNLMNTTAVAKEVNLKDLLEERVEDEMDLSDGEEKESEDAEKSEMKR